ncbi:hypothetical protein BD770DRAFT_409454 [Pilaira anomala]|nr:hypothetical protein BD770DRAFT_409454 [Pilaira anomala]
MSLLLDNEIRHDIIEFFPTILNKEIYFKLLEEINMNTLTINEPQVMDDNYLKKYSRWKVLLSVLKRLDSIDCDWNIMPQPSLHHMPFMYLEQPIPLLCDTVNNWDPKTKLKYFPVIPTRAMMMKKKKKKPLSNKKRLQLNPELVDKLTQLDQMTMTTQPVIQIMNTPPRDKVILNDTAKEIKLNTTHSKSLNTFLPQNKLDDFKFIQSCLKKKRSSNRTCELDNLRFQFDSSS